MAVLEAFVYDPLINWRLMQTDGRGPQGISFIPLTKVSPFISLAEAGSDAERSELVQLAHAAAYAQGPARKLKADENDIFSGEFLSKKYLIIAKSRSQTELVYAVFRKYEMRGRSSSTTEYRTN